MQRRFSDVRVKDVEICPTLEQGAGGGGGNVPMILDTLVFDEAQVTSPINGNNPSWGASCHTLSKECGRIDVIIKYADIDNNGERSERRVDETREQRHISNASLTDEAP